MHMHTYRVFFLFCNALKFFKTVFIKLSIFLANASEITAYRSDDAIVKTTEDHYESKVISAKSNLEIKQASQEVLTLVGVAVSY